KNLKEVSEETERVYRRLANAVAMKEDFFAECTSIRDALTHLAKYDPDTLELKPERPRQTKVAKSKSGSSATALQPAPPTDPVAVLQASDADEIITNIRDDADKLEGVARGSIIALTPQAVCDALKETWDRERIIDLHDLLAAHLKATIQTGGDARPP